MGGGTEAYPDLGQHCQHEDCKLLDFLPFTCAGCQKVFCLDHRTYKSHSCPAAEHTNRIVVICEACSVSIEKLPGDEDDKSVFERHKASGECDPIGAKNRRPNRCPVRRCKELLTFSNNSTCKFCKQRVCLKHRFPSDHICSLKSRSGTDCGVKERARNPSTPLPIRAC